LVFGSDGGVNGAGFWIDDIAFDSGTDVTEAPPVDSPRTAGLALFPNPLRGAGTVAWRLAAPGLLTVDLFDVRGARVRRLFEGSTATPSGAIDFDGRDERGRPLPPGVYFLRLASAGGEETQRVVVQR
jgi:hypothetical protein